MTNDTLMGSPHVADGDILRFHDGECGQIERRRIARHLDECPVCAASAHFLEASTKRLNVSLTELDVPPNGNAKERFLAASANVARPLPQSNPHSTPLLRAAIVVFALLGAGMWAPPVRAWFVEFFTPARPVVVTSTPDTGDGVVATQRTSSTISFVPDAATFVIDVATTQASGSLAIRVGGSESRSASTRVMGPAPADSVLVTGNGIRIRNTAASVAVYSITVPPSVQRIRVQLGGVAARFYDTDAIAASDSLVIALGR